MNKLFKSILGFLTVAVPGITLQASGAAPRLVVGIHIDQLNTDYLEWFTGGFSEDGFKKLINDGIVYKKLEYGFVCPDAASASAGISSGTTPFVNGIIAKEWFDRKTGKNVSCVSDENFLGNYTKSRYSPMNLACSTIGDELENGTGGESKVFSVGISAEETILSTGHFADGVFWIDDETGNWCTSTYYNYMPWWLQRINDSRDISQIIDRTAWEPLYPLSSYHYMPYQTSPTLFKYLLDKYGKNKYRAFKETPVVNHEVCNVGIETIEKEKLGTDDIPDYLIINMSAAGLLDNERQMSSVEIQDIYFRLDQEISRLLDVIERQAGLENSLIYLTGTGMPQNAAIEPPASRKFGGNFYPDRCVSLLNLYLMAIYGNEQWISAYSNQQIYLNRDLIEKKGIKYDEISLKASEFLGEFSGIQRVVRNRQLYTGEVDVTLIKHRNGINPDHSGDFYIEIKPGWNIRNSDKKKDRQIRYEGLNPALIFYGKGLKPKTIYETISSDDIASTLSKVFRIRPPNANRGLVLKEIVH